MPLYFAAIADIYAFALPRAMLQDAIRRLPLDMPADIHYAVCAFIIIYASRRFT